MSYETLLQVMAEERGLPRRVIIPVPVLTPFLSSLWIHLVTPVSARMARPLAEGLRNRVVVQDDPAARLMPQQLLGVREAIRIALDAEARSDVESTWSAAGPDRRAIRTGPAATCSSIRASASSRRRPSRCSTC